MVNKKYIVLFLAVFVFVLAFEGVSAQLSTTHPRLMSAAWLSMLSTWSNDPSWGPWTRFQTLANTNFGDNDDASRLVAKALMWKMGKGNAYLTSALSNFDNVVNGIVSDNAIASKATYVAYAYDLLYDQLPVASQKSAVDKFVAWQGTAKASPWVASRFVFQNYGIEVWAPAFIAAAAGAYDPANVINNLDVEYNYWKTNYFNPALYWANQVFHGAMQEGTYYGTVKDTNYFLHAADAVYMAEGIDVFNQNDWFTKRLTWEWQTYSIPFKFTDPVGGIGEYGLYYHAWGHSERLRASVPFQARLNIQLLLSRVTSNPYRGQIYSYLYGNADPDLNKPVYNFFSGGALWAFIYGAKDIASQAVPQSLQFWTTNVNTTYGSGYAFMRTGYTADDTYVSFKCGDMLSRGHDNEEEGTFQLWAKGQDLAIHSGAYDGSGEFSQTSDYFGRTVSMNGIIVYDPNEKFHLLGSNRDNDGGQRSYTNWPQEYKSTGSDETSAFNNWLTDSKQPGGTLNPPGVNEKGRLLKADSLNNEYSYVFCDLTRAYNSDRYVEGSVNIPKLSNLTRELALVDNKYLIVMDRLTKKSASHQDKWLLHTQTSFSVNGIETIPSAGEQVYTNTNGAFSTTVNNAKLFGQVVFPNSNFQVRRFNGDKRYWNYVKNVPIISNLWYGINWGADRIEIEPIDTNLQHNYLVVLYPTILSDLMPSISSIDSTNMQGTLILDSITPRIVLFSKDGSLQNNVAYDATYSGTGKHLITNMQPGNYNIYKNGVLVTTKIASSQGTLSFESTGGSTFTITTGQAPQDTCITNGGQCLINGCVNYQNCLSLSGTCTTGYCCSGTCTAMTCTDNDLDLYNQTGIGCGAVDCNDLNSNIHPGALEICGNGIDEDCSGADLACPLSPATCQFSIAQWSTTSATEENIVSLNLQGTDCDGKTISFVVWEDDLIGDDPVITNPVNAVFSGNTATGSWTAEWQDDALTDPEYYFIASLTTNSTETITSTNQLIVSKGAVSSLCPDYALNGNK